MRGILVGVVVFAVGCAGDQRGEPRQVLPYAETGNLQLYVSNQSFAIDPVDIQVRLDGLIAVEGDFFVEGQHSWHVFKFQLTPGIHTLKATSEVGEAELTETISLLDKKYPVLDYWYYPPGSDAEVTPKQLTLNVFEDPPLFD